MPAAENHSVINTFDSVLKKIEKALSFIAMLLLLGFMLVGTANVIARFVFSSPIIGATEISQLMMAGSFLLALAITQANKQHTAMTDIVKRYPEKVRHAVEFAVLFVALVLFGIMTWRSSLGVYNIWQYGEVVEVIRIPAAPFRLLLPVGTFVLCLEFISQMLHLAVNMKRREI